MAIKVLRTRAHTTQRAHHRGASADMGATSASCENLVGITVLD